MRCLVVEDDPDIQADLARALEAAGFVVDRAGDGDDAWYRGDVEDYDAAVLDLGLPRLDGLSVLRRWRAAGRAFPVIIVSARGDWTEKVEGIEAGADDYMAKPFEMGELVARVRALVRRGAGRVSSVVAIGGLRLDTMRMSAVFNGAPARLSPLEFRLLDYLSHQSGRAVSAGELAEHLYGAAEDGDTNAIEAIVARLRRKFGAGIIVTRRGFGYLLEPSA
ncbi:two-component system response regulator [Rhodanobacter sp. Root480]|jgi:DNA-binding response OmpR family regulator|uniref:response regulator transcription factor n=1 Tax=unclassified Rhodanobacter TaxID=2621553 RepID=UPI0006F778CD|nr:MULTISPECIES: response regulator transcription factor [unclassified Rhodanobacter]KQX97478.1 two-component system response regulator [Rhodanobacter sp. Root480]KRA33270.1 two-component system response regulator [Rhodanobacter sp. Root627]